MTTVIFDRETLLANHRRLAAAWGDRLPERCDDTRRRADAALRGEQLPGVDNPLCGRGLLDFLAAAYHATGDERYAVAGRLRLEEELAKADAQHLGTLMISFTVGNTAVPGWLGTLPYFLASPAFDDAFACRVVDIAANLLDFLQEHIGQESMNWRIAHADSLLLNGLRLGVDRWRACGAAALNDAFYRQFLPDGVHIERNPHYHTWPLWMMDAWHQLGQALPELGIVFTTEGMARAWDYALGATRPNGDENGMHDYRADGVGDVGYLHQHPHPRRRGRGGHLPSRLEDGQPVAGRAHRRGEGLPFVHARRRRAGGVGHAPAGSHRIRRRARVGRGFLHGLFL